MGIPSIQLHTTLITRGVRVLPRPVSADAKMTNAVSPSCRIPAIRKMGIAVVTTWRSVV